MGLDEKAGAEPVLVPTWQIEENRWSACRHGVEGWMADIETGRRRATRDCLNELLDSLEPIALRLGSTRALDHAREMIEVNGAVMQRRIIGQEGSEAVAEWLARRFSEPWVG